MSNSSKSKACLKREQKWAMEGISFQLCRSVSAPPDGDPAEGPTSSSGSGACLFFLSLLLDDLLACLLALLLLRDISVGTSTLLHSFPDFSSSNRFFLLWSFFVVVFSKAFDARCDSKTFTCNFAARIFTSRILMLVIYNW